MLSHKIIFFLVPTCSGTVMTMLMMGVISDPHLADCFAGLQVNPLDNGQLNQAACNCVIKMTPEKFYAWTGIEPSSCGLGNGLSVEEQRNMCMTRSRLKLPESIYAFNCNLIL